MKNRRFDSDIAYERGTATYAPLSDAGNRPPRVHFALLEDGATMAASPPGARIDCELETDGYSHVQLSDMRPGHEWDHIADVRVRVPEGTDVTEETIAIASAIYWSWWRARDMEGKAP